MSTVKKAPFAWNEKNTATIVKMYAESNNNNAKANLDSIAKAVGAKSAASVRSKLGSEKVYVKVEAASKKPATAKTTKTESVWTLESTLNIKKDSLDGLANGATAAQLNTIQKAVLEFDKPENITAAYERLQAQIVADEKAAQEQELQEQVEQEENEEKEREQQELDELAAEY